MAEELEKAHLYYDEINKLRVLDISVLKETDELRTFSKDYEKSRCTIPMLAAFYH